MRDTLRRMAVWTLAAAAAAFALPTFRDWWSLRATGLMRVDYTLYYATAVQGLRAGWPRLYDLEAQRAVFQQIGVGLWWFPNVHTPLLALVMVPFTHLSLQTGYLLWSALMLGSLIFAWLCVAPGDAPSRALHLALLFIPYPVALGLWMGQVVALQAAALALCYLLLRRGDDVAAGAALALIALKPQGLFLVPLALLAAGRRRAFISGALCLAACAALALALIGPAGAKSYFDRLAYAQSHAPEFWVNWSYTLPRHFEGAAKIGIQLLAVAVALFAAFRHRARIELVLAAGVLGSLLATPFVHLEDFILLFPAGWMTLRAQPSPVTALGLVALYAALYLCGLSEHVWGRWVLLGECLWLAALAATSFQRANLRSAAA